MDGVLLFDTVHLFSAEHTILFYVVVRTWSGDADVVGNANVVAIVFTPADKRRTEVHSWICRCMHDHGNNAALLGKDRVQR